MHHFFTLQSMARLSLAIIGIGLYSCNTSEDSGLAEPCATTATVRLCHGRTAVCDTEHTTLVLANGTQLRPSGKVWESYQPRQMDGQTLRISYQIVPRQTNDIVDYQNATLSCLEEYEGRGTR